MSDTAPNQMPIAGALTPADAMVERLLGALRLDELAAEAAQLALAEGRAELAALVVGDPQHERLSVAGRAVSPPLRKAGPSDRLCCALAELALARDAEVWVGRERAAEGDADLQQLGRAEGLAAALALPLAAHGRPAGALIVAWQGRPAALGLHERERLGVLARYVALALTHVRRYDALARAQALLDQSGLAMLVVNRATLDIVEASRAAVAMSGYSEAELLALPLGRVLSGEVMDGRRLASLPPGPGPLAEHEGGLRTRDGAVIPVSVGISAIEDRGARLLLLVVRDISQRWHAVQQLLLAERLAAMSRLTAVIAHEINNPLQAIANSLHLLGRPLPEEKRERYLHLAQAEVDSLVTLVRRTLDLYQPSPGGMRPISIRALLESTLDLLSSQLAQRGISVEREWASTLPRVIGIGSHLKEAFVNLVLNALEAMPHGGRLLIRASASAATAGLAQTVTVEVADTGPGIAEEHLQEIFEPFYTTKRAGVGLGLSICYSIIEHHAGRLAVSSSSSGTTFRVTLPAAVSGDALPGG